MRILRVAHKVYPEVKGGASYHVHAMSRDQAAMGHEVTVLTVRHHSDTPQVEQRDGYTIVRFDPTISPLGNDVSVGLARHLTNADGFDVVHAHSHLYFATNLAAINRWLGDTPLAITNHGLFSQNAPAWAFDLYIRSLGRWTFNRADVVFCYTDVDRERLREYGVRSDIAVVPNGIDLERFTPEGPASDRIESDGAAVVFVGRLVDGKRPQDAIDTIETVRRERPNARLYFCGNGPLRGSLETRAAALGDSVQFLGQIPYDEMPKIYRSADALVLPSRAEGVPRTMLEAQAAGIPVVASELDQIRPVATARDRLVPDGDVESFASALHEVLENGAGSIAPGVGSKSETGSNRSWDETVTRTTRVLEELTGKTPELVQR